MIVEYLLNKVFFPNSFSYGVFANIGSGAVPGRLPGQVPGGSGKVPGQVPNHRFREGSGAGSESRVPGRLRGSGAERQVPGRFRGRLRTTGSGKVPGSERQVPGRFRVRARFRTTGSRKVPGQVPNHGFRGRL